MPKPKKTREYRLQYYKDYNKGRKDKLHSYYLANKDRQQSNARLRDYGVTAEEYQRLLTKQMDGCAICGTTVPGGSAKYNVWGFCVDHNHTTGTVRGLLCFNCNRAAGLLKDSSAHCRKMASYLESRGRCNA